MINIKKNFLGTVAMASLVLFLPSVASACFCGCGSKGKHNSHYRSHNNHHNHYRGHNYRYGHYNNKDWYNKQPHKSFFPCLSFLGCGNHGNHWSHVSHAKYGQISGVVYFDANGNGRQDSRENGTRGIVVSVLDSRGHTKSARTGSTGYYCITNVAVGNATVTVRESTLPNNASLTAGNNPSRVNVVGNKKNDAGKDGYVFPQAPAPKTGKVCGSVFLDQNGNGQQDNGEMGTRGIVVSILDSNGDTKRGRTDASGSYCVNNIAVGNATVTVRESTLPQNAVLTVGNNPSNLNVRANQNNNAGTDGYVLPQAPAPKTGKVCGVVFLDDNGNGQQDNGETGTRGIVVSVLDSNGDTKRARTRASGSYCINNVAVGNATVTVRESTLPNNASLTVGDNPSSVTVVGNKRNNAGKDGYVLPQAPAPKTGKVCGIVFLDANGNGQQDNGETGTRGIVVSVLDSNGDTKRGRTRASGSYCVTKVAEGEATVTLKESTLPNNATLTVGNNPSSIDVIGNQDNNVGQYGYVLPQAPAPETGRVCGIVFFDKNGNGKEDNGETGTRGIVVSIVDSNGDTKTTKTGKTGSYCLTKVAEGEATVTVKESTLPNNASLTVGNNPSSVDVVANQSNNAGKDGYVLPQAPAPETGKVCGVVYLDENGNGKQDNEETGIRGIVISVVDSKGDTQRAKTAKTGSYCVNNVAVGEAIVTIKESTLPSHADLSVGDNPSSVDVIANKRNNAGKDGYSIGGPTD